MRPSLLALQVVDHGSAREQLDAPIDPMQDVLLIWVAVPLLVLLVLAVLLRRRQRSRGRS